MHPNYAGKEGIRTKVEAGLSEGESLAFWNGRSITISAQTDGRISRLFNNPYNLMSAIYHEDIHRQDELAGVKLTYMSHSEVYYKEMINPNFTKGTEEAQLGIVVSFVNHLYNASLHKEEGVGAMIQKFNNAKIGFTIGLGSAGQPGWPIFYKGVSYSTSLSVLDNPSQ